MSYARFGVEEADAGDRGELREFFDNVGRSAETLLDLVNDLLDLSKLEAGRMTFDLQPTRVETPIEVVVDEFRSMVTRKGISISYSKPEEVTIVLADEERIKQVIRNLLSNAVKFSPDGGTIQVRTRRIGKTCLTSVRDEGPGIPPDELEIVFDKFMQSSNTKSGSGGTGLGLAICREIVAGTSGADLGRKQCPEGLCFLLRIALGSPCGERRIRRRNCRRWCGRGGRGRLWRGPMTTSGRILIVDDIPTNVDILRRILRKDYDLDTAASGEDCLAKLSTFKPQLVLLDIMMPGIDGYETCRRIKSSELGEFIQVILVSGKGSPAERLQGYASQADDYIVKPFNHEELLSKVRVHFRLGNTQRQLSTAKEQLQVYAHDLEQLVEHRTRQWAKMRDMVVVRTAELTTANQELQNEVSQRRQAEEALTRQAVVLQQANTAALAALQAKSDFLANMSHEIRTPMTAILGYVDIMLDESIGPATREHVEVIKRNGAHLLGLINDILDFSKVESGKLQVKLTRCSPRQAVVEVVSLMRVRAEAKKLMLQAEFVGLLPETILSDPLRLRQVLVNLVGNAIKFTDQGQVRLAVRLMWDSGHPRLCFDVSDTGIGISEEHVKQLFQPFTQVDNSSTRKFGGTGLGLCISKRLAETLGGDIEVNSTLGKGSTFRAIIDPGATGRDSHDPRGRRGAA